MERSTRLEIRLSLDELATIKEKAKICGISTSELLRISALGQELPTPIAGLEGLPEYNRQLQKLGNNLNQFLVLCHKKQYPYSQHINEALSEAIKVVRETWPLLSSFAPAKARQHSATSSTTLSTQKKQSPI